MTNGSFISRKGNLFNSKYKNWPARSPDLSPLDFYLWDSIKNKLFSDTIPANYDDCVKKINEICNDYSTNMSPIRNSILGVKKRAIMCFDQEGGKFEYLK